MVKVTSTKDAEILHCCYCGALAVVNHEGDAKFAYREINRFRGNHEHLEALQCKKIVVRRV